MTATLTHTQAHATVTTTQKRKDKKKKNSVAGSFCGRVSALFGFSCRCATRGCSVGFLCRRLQRRGSPAGAPLSCLSIWRGQGRRPLLLLLLLSSSSTFCPVCVTMQLQPLLWRHGVRQAALFESHAPFFALYLPPKPVSWVFIGN